MRTLETLCLDAGGVLVHPNWTRVRDALARHGVRVDAAVLARAEADAKRALDVPAWMAGTTDADRWAPYFDLVLAHAGVAAGPATAAAVQELRAYHARVNLWETVASDALAALRRLRAAGLKLAVVSNANGTLRAALARVGLAPHLDVVVDSHEVGCEKPDARIFHLALARVGGRPETALHVGDLYHVDVVGARNAGLDAVLLDAAGLYAGHDCARAGSLSALVEQIGAARA